MKLKMHENSLFAVLLRSPWWVSAAVAGGLFMLIRIWFAWIYAAFAALPFTVIACYVAWQQLRRPSPEKILKKLEGIRAMSAEEFARAIEAGFRRGGYGVARLDKGPVDMELSRGGRVSLVVFRRWKAAHSGIGPLEELDALRRKQKADECIFITAGELSVPARQFAGEKGVKLVEGQGLVQLLA
jgi:restriction system protein